MWYVNCSDPDVLRVFVECLGVYMEFKHQFPATLHAHTGTNTLVSNVSPAVVRRMSRAPPNLMLVPNDIRLGSYLAADNMLICLDVDRFAFYDRVEIPNAAVYLMRARVSNEVYEIDLGSVLDEGEVGGEAH